MISNRLYRSIESPNNQQYLYSCIKSNEMFKSVFDLKSNKNLKIDKVKLKIPIKSFNDYI